MSGPRIPLRVIRAWPARRPFVDVHPLKATWSAGVSPDGRYVLNGGQVFYYPNGQKQWEAEIQSGRRSGVETWWNSAGAKQWERTYGAGGTWTWRIYDASSKVSAESRWQGKKLLEANPTGSLSR